MATRKPRQNRSKVTVDTIIEAGLSLLLPMEPVEQRPAILLILLE